MSELERSLATGAIALVAAALQSMTGFGFAVVAVPLLALVWRPAEAVAISMALSTLCVAFLWPRVRRAERVPIVRSLFLTALFGLPIGLWALSNVDVSWLRLAIGGVTLATASVMGLSAFRTTPAVGGQTPGKSITLLTGFIAGILTGALSMPGPPAVMLLSASRIPKVAYRATLTAFAMLIYPVGLAAMVAERLVSPAIGLQVLIQAPVVACGFWLGDRLHGAASERAFSLLSLALLGMSGVLCIAHR